MMESIAPADVSLPSTPDTDLPWIPRSINCSISEIFPPAKSVCSSDSSSEHSLIPHFSPYSIQTFFPPAHSRSSVSSEGSLYDLSYSIASFIQPNHSYPPIESAHHPQITKNKSKLIHELNFFLSKIKRQFHGSERITRRPIEFTRRPIEFRTYGQNRIFPQQVEAEFEKAQKRWTYAIYWKLDRPSKSPLGGTFSPTKSFNNGNMAYSFFDLIDSGPDTIFQSVIDQVFSTSKPICLVEKDLLASSPYYRGREGLDYGLQTMYWIRIADGVMEFGSTELIHPVHRKKKKKKELNHPA
uniref:Uncharacterized protein n=1 Tax=Quercus lobata TaxID=97700 RepID=A0A7N2MWL2_QUELO